MTSKFDTESEEWKQFQKDLQMAVVIANNQTQELQDEKEQLQVCCQGVVMVYQGVVRVLSVFSWCCQCVVRVFLWCCQGVGSQETHNKAQNFNGIFDFKVNFLVHFCF